MNSTPVQLFVQTGTGIALESAPWVVLSLLVGGLVHEFLPDSRFRRFLNRPGSSAMGGAILLGGLLPICSCGVIPLAVSLYRSGVRLGPVMAFAAATPIINPAAVILSLALLGPRLTSAYVLLGLTLPLLMGHLAQRWGERPVLPVDAPGGANDCCASNNASPDTTGTEPPFQQRLLRGLRWGLATLGPTIGFYLAIGILLAAALHAFVPADWTERYLGNEAGIGLVAAALFGASIYVCAVAHIPMVAALLAAGAAPGAAIVFLLTGTATNLPELFTLYKTIGRRTVLVYSGVLIVASILAGVLVNLWLLPGFEPAFDPVASLAMLEQGERLWWSPSVTVKWSSALVVTALAVWGTAQHLWRLAPSRGNDGCCSGE